MLDPDGPLARVIIVNWGIPEAPSDHVLKVTVEFRPWKVRETFYLVHTPPEVGTATRRAVPQSWDWCLWSMAGKPTVEVRDQEVLRGLDHLVATHDVLRALVGKHFELSDWTPADNDSRERQPNPSDSGRSEP